MARRAFRQPMFRARMFAATSSVPGVKPISLQSLPDTERWDSGSAAVVGGAASGSAAVTARAASASRVLSVNWSLSGLWREDHLKPGRRGVGAVKPASYAARAPRPIGDYGSGARSTVEDSRLALLTLASGPVARETTTCQVCRAIV